MLLCQRYSFLKRRRFAPPQILLLPRYHVCFTNLTKTQPYNTEYNVLKVQKQDEGKHLNLLILAETIIQECKNKAVGTGLFDPLSNMIELLENGKNEEQVRSDEASERLEREC